MINQHKDVTAEQYKYHHFLIICSTFPRVSALPLLPVLPVFPVLPAFPVLPVFPVLPALPMLPALPTVPGFLHYLCYLGSLPCCTLVCSIVT